MTYSDWLSERKMGHIGHIYIQFVIDFSLIVDTKILSNVLKYCKLKPGLNKLKKKSSNLS